MSAEATDVSEDLEIDPTDGGKSNLLPEKPEAKAKPEQVGQTQEGEDGEDPKKAKRPDLEAALAELAGQVTKIATPPKVEKPMTQEEVNAKWAVWNPTEKEKDYYKEFFGLADDVDDKVLQRKMLLFAQMQQGLVRQSIVGATNVFEHKFGGELAKIKELEEWRSQATAKELRQDFQRTYPALAEKKYDKIIKLISADLADKEFKSHEEYFQALAEGAAEAIKEYVPDFDLGAKTKPTAGKSPSLPRTRVGGTGGAGGGGGKAQSSEDDQSHTLE